VTHLLLISRGNQIPESLRETAAAPDIRVVTRHAPEEAETALGREVFDAVIVYTRGADERPAEQIARLRRHEQLFILVIAERFSPEVERAVFEAGADLYLAEPFSERSLRRVMPRRRDAPDEVVPPVPPLPPGGSSGSAPALNALSPLHVLRDFSNVLGFSLDYKAFTQHFILKLREHISFSRIGIFIESSTKRPFARGPGSRRLECIASLGIPSDLIECFELSRDIGIGRRLGDYPQVLNASGPEADRDPGIRKEFAILGCHLAVPVNDRERMIGVAVLNGPVTGRSYTEDELQLLYLLMEELGLAIRNSRLHLELSNHGQLIESVLGSILSGAIVIDESLAVLYANEAARKFLRADPAGNRPIEFAELPSKLAGAVHRAVEKGETGEPFFLSGRNEAEIFRTTLLPFMPKGELSLLPRPTMVLLEDFTKIEATKQLALENSREELIGLIAERFAHEIRNSLVPLSTHAQLIDKRIDDPKFQKSLKSSLLKETARIKRFSEQMLYLAQHSSGADADIELLELIQSAFKKAKRQLGSPGAKIGFNADFPEGLVHGNIEALAYAFEELFFNAIQASPDDPAVQVEVRRSSEGIFRIRIRDNGMGFDEDIIARATEPFYTTRNTGVGLGLSVASKVIGEHHGFLRLNRRSPERNWDLELEIPEHISSIKHV